MSSSNENPIQNGSVPSSRADRLDAIVKMLEEKRSQSDKPMFVVAIDGRCGSGKTTLASLLVDRLDDCSILHMDDFFLRPEDRTLVRLKTPGANVDYERILDEVLLPLQKKEETIYCPFSCRTMTLQSARALKRPRILLLEGTYSANAHLLPFVDFLLFLTCSKEEQKERLLKREGAEKYANFEAKWIPLEENYFENGLDTNAIDQIVDTSF